jgi:uncharacterized protein (DUF924 family)
MAENVTPQEILDYWFKEVGPDGWFAISDAVDAETLRRFGDAWRQACAGDFVSWRESPDGALALIILLDQFPRNMFRETGETFASDPLALDVAELAVDHQLDLQVPGDIRSFFFMPFMHCEAIEAQDRCVELFQERLPESKSLQYAKDHREIIQKFGRFPHRNDLLGRSSTEDELTFLRDSGFAPGRKSPP